MSAESMESKPVITDPFFGPYEPSGWTDGEKEAFKKAAQPLVEWMRKEMHPHATAIVTNQSAEVLNPEIRLVCPLLKRIPKE